MIARNIVYHYIRDKEFPDYKLTKLEEEDYFKPFNIKAGNDSETHIKSKGDVIRKIKKAVTQQGTNEFGNDFDDFEEEEFGDDIDEFYQCERVDQMVKGYLNT